MPRDGHAVGPLSCPVILPLFSFSSADILRNFDTPKISAQFDVRKVSETQKNTQKHDFLYCNIKNQ
jgi:hypothetical protein